METRTNDVDTRTLYERIALGNSFADAEDRAERTPASAAVDAGSSERIFNGWWDDRFARRMKELVAGTRNRHPRTP